MQETQLYAISAGVSGPVKVGISGAPAVRVASLQTGNPQRALHGEWLDLSEQFVADYMRDFLRAEGYV